MTYGTRTRHVAFYGCEHDEAALLREIAPRFSIRPTIVAAPLSEANAALAAGHRCISISHRSAVTDSTLLALRRAGVEYVSTRSIGSNHLDVDYARSIGITVGNVAYSPDGVADHTLLLMLLAIRGAKSTILRAEAHDYRLNAARGRELRDLTVGVIGTGRIGTAVIDRLRGFGCRVIVHDIRAANPADTSLDELLDESDIVTLHVPLTAETHHLLDRQRLERMKPGAFIINTARGALIDTESLLNALENGRLGGAALDVVEGEAGVFYADRRGKPIGETLARLQRLPNVVITPHTAYYTDHALLDIARNSLVNCLNYESENPHA